MMERVAVYRVPKDQIWLKYIPDLPRQDMYVRVVRLPEGCTYVPVIGANAPLYVDMHRKACVVLPDGRKVWIPARLLRDARTGERLDLTEDGHVAG